MLESTNKTPKNISPSQVVKKESQTSSRALPKESSSQSKSKRKVADQPQNKLSSSQGSTIVGVSASLPTRWTKLLVKLVSLPKAIFLWALFKLTTMLLNFRNRPQKFLVHPDKRLKRTAEPVDFNVTNIGKRTTIVRKMASALAKTTYGMKLGIAAPQIGINKRVIIVRGNVMFNPEWNPTKAPPNQYTEGCYSVPNKLFKVYRPSYGWAKWTNIEGRPFESKLTGLPALVFQHELSHLDGKCLPDYAEEIKPKVETKNQ